MSPILAAPKPAPPARPASASHQRSAAQRVAVCLFPEDTSSGPPPSQIIVKAEIPPPPTPSAISRPGSSKRLATAASPRPLTAPNVLPPSSTANLKAAALRSSRHANSNNKQRQQNPPAPAASAASVGAKRLHTAPTRRGPQLSVRSYIRSSPPLTKTEDPAVTVDLQHVRRVIFDAFRTVPALQRIAYFQKLALDEKDSQLIALQQVFDLMDEEGKGTVTLSKFLTFGARLGGKAAERAFSARIFSLLISLSSPHSHITTTTTHTGVNRGIYSSSEPGGSVLSKQAFLHRLSGSDETHHSPHRPLSPLKQSQPPTSSLSPKVESYASFRGKPKGHSTSNPLGGSEHGGVDYAGGGSEVSSLANTATSNMIVNAGISLSEEERPEVRKLLASWPEEDLRILLCMFHESDTDRDGLVSAMDLLRFVMASGHTVEGGNNNHHHRTGARSQTTRHDTEAQNRAPELPASESGDLVVAAADEDRSKDFFLSPEHAALLENFAAQIERFDANRDGRVNFSEFVAMQAPAFVLQRDQKKQAQETLSFPLLFQHIQAGW